MKSEKSRQLSHGGAYWHPPRDDVESAAADRFLCGYAREKSVCCRLAHGEQAGQA